MFLLAGAEDRSGVVVKKTKKGQKEERERKKKNSRAQQQRRKIRGKKPKWRAAKEDRSKRQKTKCSCTCPGEGEGRGVTTCRRGGKRCFELQQVKSSKRETVVHFKRKEEATKKGKKKKKKISEDERTEAHTTSTCAGLCTNASLWISCKTQTKRRIGKRPGRVCVCGKKGWGEGGRKLGVGGRSVLGHEPRCET